MFVKENYNMGYRYKWKPSKTAKREFKSKMKEVEEFCNKNGIDYSANKDSYYFVINDKQYRVSNHSVESSNKHAFNQYGEQVRGLYHPLGRSEYVTYIHASKTRIIDIYNDLKDGYVLDGHGNRIKSL